MAGSSAIRRATTDSIVISDWEHDIPGHLSDDSKTYLFPEVTGQTQHGKISEWLISIRIYDDMDNAQRNRHSLVIAPEIANNKDKRNGYVARILVYCWTYSEGTDKAGLTPYKREPTFVECGKNVGRANETNVFCQALRDAFGLYNKQRRRACAIDDEPETSDKESSEGGTSESAGVPMAAVFPLPMLAKPYADVFRPGSSRNSSGKSSGSSRASPSPIYVQRKFNGVRAVGMVADGVTWLYSRKGIDYSGFPLVRADVRRICDAWAQRTLWNEDAGSLNGPDNPRQNGTLYLDGELYKHGMSLQQISGIVRRPSDTDAQSVLNFVVYDVFVINKGCTEANNLPFDDRFSIIRAIQRSPVFASLQRIQFAETFTCVDAKPDAVPHVLAIDRAKELCTQFLEEGYEGAIVRLNAPYKHSPNDYHSNVLLKIKPTRDAEYKIVGFTTGKKGKAAGALLFICETGGSRSDPQRSDPQRSDPQGPIQFNITPTGTIARRIEMATDFARIEENGRTVFENNWLGRPLIVTFDELSTDGVPQRARTDGTIRTCD